MAQEPCLCITPKMGGLYWKAKLVLYWPNKLTMMSVNKNKDLAEHNVYLLACQLLQVSKEGMIKCTTLLIYLSRTSRLLSHFSHNSPVNIYNMVYVFANCSSGPTNVRCMSLDKPLFIDLLQW